MSKPTIVWHRIFTWPPAGAPEDAQGFWVRDHRGEINPASASSTRDGSWIWWAERPLEEYDRRDPVEPVYSTTEKGKALAEDWRGVLARWHNADGAVAVEPDGVIDTGDTVRHIPSDEEWVVAFSDNGMICCCGWPLTIVPIGDCRLLERATPEKRFELLSDMLTLRGDNGRDDIRGIYARRRLSQRPTVL